MIYLLTALAVLALAAFWVRPFWLRRKEVKGYLKVGGRLVARSEWSPEVLEQVRQSFFRPPANAGFLVLLDVTMTCPAGHATGASMGIVSINVDLARATAARIVWSRAEAPCTTCGRPAKLTAQSPRWEGRFADWDNAL